MILDTIHDCNDIKAVEEKDLPRLAEEIRTFLIESLSETGGHLASNLGVVELTMALHLALNLPEDKLIWDVGHQAYTHKILTGRKEGFASLRKFGGMSGFPKREESSCDAFNTGHSSTSISAGIGFVRGRDLQGQDYKVVSVIGDGSLTGGMAWEALNNAAQLKTNFIIVLNDNEMSIDHNVGGLSTYLSGLRTSEAYTDLKNRAEQSLNKIPVYGNRVVEGLRNTKNGIKQFFIPGMLFENLGVRYLGPIDGHDIKQMVRVLKDAARYPGAVVVHVKTKKGKGYLPAERHPARFHGTEPFEIETGLPKSGRHKANYQDVFATVMCKMGARNEKLCAVTAAMPNGTGLKRFQCLYPERYFDVGIAEAHAVTFSSALAMSGMIPVFAVYSSFLQRGFDQVIHDMCLQEQHVILAIDRGGLVGSDGETHQGIFDMSFLNMVPNLTVMAPKNKWELADMLKYAIGADGPMAIRYPRGTAYDGLEDFRAPIAAGRSEVIYDEKDIALVAVGSMVKSAVSVRQRLRDMGYSCSLINARFVKPLDTDMLRSVAADHRLIVTMEENVLTGGFGEQVITYLSDTGYTGKVLHIALPDEYVEHGNVEILKQELGIDEDSILKKIIAAFVGMSSEEK